MNYLCNEKANVQNGKRKDTSFFPPTEFRMNFTLGPPQAETYYNPGVAMNDGSHECTCVTQTWSHSSQIPAVSTNLMRQRQIIIAGAGSRRQRLRLNTSSGEKYEVELFIVLTINGYRPEHVEPQPDWLSRTRELQEISRRRHECREEVGERNPSSSSSSNIHIHYILI